jgi:pimeloyl-ACP methyl ester carboxylesterase
MLENTSPEGYAACCAAIRDMDQRDAVSQISLPTLVIYGASDAVIPLPDAHFLTQQIRGARELELAAAHLSNLEQAEEFTQAVLSFLCNQ